MEENQEPETINNELIEQEEEEQNSDQDQDQDQDQYRKEEEVEEITTIEPNRLTSSSSDSPLSEWRDLIEAVEDALTITPVEDPEAERLERILDTVNDYINSEFVDENIPEVEKTNKISKFKNSVTSIVTKISKFTPVSFSAIR